MAEYLPPTENLPKFNEFVFDDAYSIEGLDRRVVHKAGIETITGNKTFTGTTTITGELIVDNVDTGIDSDNIILSSGGPLGVKYNQTATTTILNNTDSISLQLGGNAVFGATDATTRDTTITGDDNLYINCGGSTKIDLSSTTTALNNDTTNITTADDLTETSTGGNITIDAPSTAFLKGYLNLNAGSQILMTGFSLLSNIVGFINLGSSGSISISSPSNQLTTNGVNTITSSLSGTDANLIDATGAGGGNKIRTDTGTNTITSTTGINTLTTGNTTTTANLIDATATGGGNTIRTTTGINRMTSTSGQNVITTGRTTTTSNLIDSTSTGGNTIRTTSGTNTITSTTGINTLTTGNTTSTANLIDATAAGGGNTIRTTTGTNTITTTTGSNTLTTGGTTATSNLIDSTSTGGNTIRTNSGTNTISSTSGNNTLTTLTGDNTMVTFSSGGVNTISSSNGSGVNPANLITATFGGLNVIRNNTGINIMEATGSGGGNQLTTSNGNNTLTAGGSGNNNLVGRLQHNTQTVNPRRQYQLDYTNGGTAIFYGVEIIKAVNDPNNILSPEPTNGKTYVEIFSNGNLATAYNSSRLNGYFIASGNSDTVSQCDFMLSTFAYNEPTFGPILSGSTSTSYTSFIFYLVGGFNYTIITDGTIGQRYNNISSAPPYDLWTPANNITYNTGTGATFAVAKVVSTSADIVGVTAASATLSNPAFFLDISIWEYATTRRNKFRITDSKIIAPEQYIASAGAATATPVVGFTKSGVRVGGTSFSTLSWGIDSTAVTQRARIPFKCRCVGVDISFDLDGTPPTVTTRFIATLGSTTAVGSSDYCYTEITILVGGWTASGNAVSQEILNQPVIPANTDFYGSWQLFNFSTGAAVTLNQEFLITFYFQQLP